MASLHDTERALAVPMKRFERPMLNYLTRAEMVAVLGQKGENWSSRRDHLLLTMLYNTGARVSEIIGVRVVDVVLDGAACVHLHGKGRRLRSIPLWDATVAEIRSWLRLNPTLHSGTRLAAQPGERHGDDARQTRSSAWRWQCQRPPRLTTTLAKRRISPQHDHPDISTAMHSPRVGRRHQCDRAVVTATKAPSPRITMSQGRSVP